jgi:hypothetical protein
MVDEKRGHVIIDLQRRERNSKAHGDVVLTIHNTKTQAPPSQTLINIIIIIIIREKTRKRKTKRESLSSLSEANIYQ